MCWRGAAGQLVVEMVCVGLDVLEDVRGWEWCVARDWIGCAGVYEAGLLWAPCIQ